MKTQEILDLELKVLIDKNLPWSVEQFSKTEIKVKYWDWL